jgi:tRNA(Arg) A34 adenosine deaminase TadA
MTGHKIAVRNPQQAHIVQAAIIAILEQLAGAPARRICPGCRALIVTAKPCPICAA